MTRTIQLAVSLGLLTLVYLGCAGARYEGVVEEEPPAKPPLLVVYDFAVTPEDVVGDAFGANFELPPPNDEPHAVARELTNAIVAKLRAKGVNATRGETTTVVPPDALMLQGQFVTIQEGSRLARMVIGFGAGRQEIRVQAQMYRWTGTEVRRVKQAEAGAHGDSMPGMATPMAAGAVISGAVAMPALISGGMNLGQEIVAGLRPTLDRLAAAIADNTVSFYRDRGWL